MEAKTLPTTKQHSQTKCSISYNYIATSVAKAAYKTNLHRRQTPVQLKLDQAITSLDIYTSEQCNPNPPDVEWGG